MKTQKHKIHLNSHVENVGSDLTLSEEGHNDYLRRRSYRYGEVEYNIDFSDNLRELVATIANENKVNTQTVWERYKQFVELSVIYSFRFLGGDKPLIYRPLWNAFLDFENGSKDSSPNHMMFKEDIYSDAYYTSLYKKLFGEQS